MRRLSNIVLILTSLICFQCSSSAKTKNSHGKDQETQVKSTLLSANEFESKLAAMPNAQLIDVRTPEEFNAGYIKGALNINYQGSTFMEEVAKLDKTKPTFVYCRSGGRSSESCNYMANQGFKELYELEDGISSWIHYKKPVEQSGN